MQYVSVFAKEDKVLTAVEGSARFSREISSLFNNDDWGEVMCADWVALSKAEIFPSVQQDPGLETHGGCGGWH